MDNLFISGNSDTHPSMIPSLPSFQQYNSFDYPFFNHPTNSLNDFYTSENNSLNLMDENRNLVDDSSNECKNEYLIATEIKNEKHRLAEKRRRDEINHCLEEIKKRLPENFIPSNSFLSKKKLLQATIQYIDQLVQNIDQLIQK